MDWAYRHSAGQTTLLNMVLVRYDEPATAGQIASQPSSTKTGRDMLHQTERLPRTDLKGRLRVVDPSHGIKAMATSDVVSWGGLSLAFCAIAGAVSGAIHNSLGGPS